MSLLWNRGRIARAVAGELSAAEELRLREHLSSCERCRGHYDRLVLTARAVRGSPEPTRTEAARAQARLEALLGGAAEPARAPQRPALQWRFAPAFAVASVLLVAGAALVLQMAQAPSGGEGWRGGAGGKTAGPTLWVHAKPKDGGPVRTVAEFPAAGEAQVTLREYLQFGLRDVSGAGYVALVGVDDGGGVHLYHPQAGDGRVEAGATEVRLGRSVDLAVGHLPGIVRLFVVTAAAPIPRDALETASALQALPGARQVGVLKVEP